MILAVLNYEYGNVEFVSNISEDIENLDDFVYDVLGYKESEIAWMLVDDDFRILKYTFDPKSQSMKYDNENFI